MTDFRTAVLVDGENVSRVDLMLLDDSICRNALRRYYTAVSERPVKLDCAWYPFELVQIPRIGKESVDRVVAMEMVDLAHGGIDLFYLVSNDYDFGDTAAHFKRMFPKVDVVIVADPARISADYPQKLAEQNIGFVEFSDEMIQDLAMKAMSLLSAHVRGNSISLHTVARVFREHGFPFQKGSLGKDLQRMGFALRDGHLKLGANGKSPPRPGA